MRAMPWPARKPRCSPRSSSWKQAAPASDRTTVDNHPDVLNAAAHVRDAYLSYARTALPAPVSGFVAKRAVQLGQRVSPGSPLMAIVPLDQVWVGRQLQGAAARRHARRPGGHARKPTSMVASVEVPRPGRSASAPEQDRRLRCSRLRTRPATGSRSCSACRCASRSIPQELAAHPLQVGLSMQVDVDTHQRTGDRLPQLTQNSAGVRDRRSFTRSMRSPTDAREGRSSPPMSAAGRSLRRAQSDRHAIRRADARRRALEEHRPEPRQDALRHRQQDRIMADIVTPARDEPAPPVAGKRRHGPAHRRRARARHRSCCRSPRS